MSSGITAFTRIAIEKSFVVHSVNALSMILTILKISLRIWNKKNVIQILPTIFGI